MRLRRRVAPLVAMTTMAAMVGIGLIGAPAALADDTVTIDILGINDFHGRLTANGQEAGAAALATAVKEMRAENPNTIFAAAGDLIGASTFTSFIQQDNPTIDALNAAGLEVSAVGNHEFDRGYDDLMNRVIPRATWEYIGANVRVKEELRDRYRELTRSWVKEIDGVKVGFVGAVTEHLDELVTPSGISMLDILDIPRTVNEVADELKAKEGADIVVLLVHEGAATTAYESAVDPASDFGKIVTGVDKNFDAIISGHTHLSYDHEIPVKEWQDEKRPVTVRPVVSAGQYGYNLNKITFTYDKVKKQAVDVDSEIVPLTERQADGSWKPLYGPDPSVKGIVDDAVEVAGREGARKLGEITADFNRARQSNGTTENRGGESTLGNLVADAQLAGARATDPATEIAFMNPGGLRTDMRYRTEGEEDGTVTYKEAAEVQPFANTLVTMTLTGEQIVQVLEEQWQPEGASRPFLKLGVSKGLFYTYDPAAPKGRHITSVTLDGKPLDPAKSYRVVVNSFLASGGDNFGTLNEGADKRDTGQVDLQSMVAYLGENSPVAPDHAQRAVGVRFDAPSGGFKAGDPVTVGLSSLLFTTVEPKDEKVTATFAGREVGTFAVDATADASTDNTDEVGRTTVEFAVPADAAQGGATSADLVVTGKTTGTTVTVAIPLAADTGPTCTVTITGRHAGPLVAGSGVTCLRDGAAVSGPVTVRKGASLYATGATVSGPISASKAADVSLDRATVNGPVTVNGATGRLTILDSTVNGPVSLTGNRVADTPIVSGNRISGPLSCSGNSPAPTDDGKVNTVSGPRTGQCAGL
ncbi:5'-nucleotidase C-terminal domain-containing protein [Sphaerimonospora mesophila]|uniref:5'-nucleotidase C-terminal domain-containing protein n=1 Tax=Sphaerimonospora mesophila TaxID=37483 RepID=UPI0006E2ED71